jgi:hypothetical protein
MPDYRIVVDMKDVAQGDATSLAQTIIDEYGEGFDVATGDFAIRVLVVDRRPTGTTVTEFSSEVDWEPRR